MELEIVKQELEKTKIEKEKLSLSFEELNELLKVKGVEIEEYKNTIKTLNDTIGHIYSRTKLLCDRITIFYEQEINKRSFLLIESNQICFEETTKKLCEIFNEIKAKNENFRRFSCLKKDPFHQTEVKSNSKQPPVPLYANSTQNSLLRIPTPNSNRVNFRESGEIKSVYRPQLFNFNDHQQTKSSQ